MRIAVSGSHATGKTSIVAELIGRLAGLTVIDEPYYLLEQEGHAFETPPSLDDFESLLARSVSLLVERHGRFAGSCRSRLSAIRSRPRAESGWPRARRFSVVAHQPSVGPSRWCSNGPRPTTSPTSPRAVAFYRDGLGWPTPGIVAQELTLAAGEWYLCAHPCPLSVVIGAQDYVDFGAVQWEDAANEIPHLHLRILPGAGHASWIDQPDIFRRTVDEAVRASAKCAPWRRREPRARRGSGRRMSAPSVGDQSLLARRALLHR